MPPTLTPTAPRPAMRFPVTALEMARLRYDFLYSQSFSLTASGRDTVSIQTMSDSWFVCQALIAGHDGTMTVQVNDTGNNRYWQNTPLEIENVFGTAQYPNVMIVPVIMPPNSQIQIAIVDTSGLGSNTGELCFSGYKIFQKEPPAGWSRSAPQWFQYGGSMALTASVIDTLNIQIQADAHFEIQKILGRNTNGNAGGGFSCRFTDSGTGKSWSDRRIQRDSQFGTAQRPRVLPFPKLIVPNTVIQAELTELTAGANTVEIVLEGVKRFDL